MNEEALFRTEIPGAGWRAYDPWKVGRLLRRELCGERLARVLGPEGVRSEDAQVAGDAEEKLIAACRVAFGLPPVLPDGDGYSEAVVRRVLNEYVAWQAQLKKNTASPLT